MTSFTSKEPAAEWGVGLIPCDVVHKEAASADLQCIPRLVFLDK